MGFSILKERQKEIPFIIFVFFLISFSIARTYVLVGIKGPSLDFGTYTLHHLYYGIILLMIAGWLAINYSHKSIQRFTAIVYGIGLGIFFDEIGLMLTHFRDYWDGLTYTIIVIASLFFMNFIFFKDFWRSVGQEVRGFARKKKLRYGPLKIMGLIDLLDEAEKKMMPTSKLAMAFAGIVLIVAGVMVIQYPDLIYYWVAAAFILSGISYIMQAVKED